MSLSRMFAGRKKECSVWQWFNYDEVQAKSTCQAIMKDGKVGYRDSFLLTLLIYIVLKI